MMAYIPSTPKFRQTGTSVFLDQSADDLSDADLYAVRSQNVGVTFMVDPDGDSTTTTGDDADTSHVTYAAAEKVSLITFRFSAEKTAIKGGSVSFRLPNTSWTTPAKPNDDADNAGRLSATVIGGKIGTISYGRQVTIPVDNLEKGGTIDIKYEDVTVQA